MTEHLLVHHLLCGLHLVFVLKIEILILFSFAVWHKLDSRFWEPYVGKAALVVVIFIIVCFSLFLKENDVSGCLNPTLDQVSMCTSHRLNDVAHRLLQRPTVQTPSGPPLTFPSQSSLLSLIRLWSSSSLACPLLQNKACWPALMPCMTLIPPLHPLPLASFSAPQMQQKHSCNHTKKSDHQHLLQETAASNWACFSTWRWWVWSFPLLCAVRPQAATCMSSLSPSLLERKKKLIIGWQWS